MAGVFRQGTFLRQGCCGGQGQWQGDQDGSAWYGLVVVRKEGPVTNALVKRGNFDHCSLVSNNFAFTVVAGEKKTNKTSPV